MSWRDSLTAFDLETDSPNPEDARIVTACVGSTVGGWKAREWLLQPERPIPDGAAAIHGVTTEMARLDGIDRETGIDQIRDALMSAWQSGAVVVIYNAPFDTTTLDREARRLGLGGLDLAGPVVDPLVIDKAIDRYRRGSRKLADVAAHYGVATEAAHDAAGDALTAAWIAYKLAGHPDVPSDLAELMEWQRDQYREQRLSFAEYRRRKGEPLDDESTDWPIRPYPMKEAA